MFVGTRKAVDLSEVLAIEVGRRVPQIRIPITLTEISVIGGRGEITVILGVIMLIITVAMGFMVIMAMAVNM